MSVYQMGPGTLPVPMSLFGNNRKRVILELQKLLQNSTNGTIIDDRTYLLLQGGSDISFNDTDVDFLFRQESYFQFMFGVKEPGCYAAIHIKTGLTTLFVPHLPADYSIWMGHLHTLEEFQKMYEVDEAQYCDDLEKFFTKVNVSVILTLSGRNSDSGLEIEPASFPGIEKFKQNCDILYPVITECRVIKSEEEIEVLRYVAKISSDAHKKVMKMMKPGKTEYQGESEFLHHAYSVGGCRHASYTCICGSGINAAVLHYGHANAPNNRVVNDGDICLFDMGGNYAGYAADITCTFPVNGKFTDDQKFIYNAVLDARNAVMNEAKEGVSWIDMHLLANKVLLTKLKEGNMLTGDVDEMMAAGLASIFQPHGLGHLLGLDVHDVGGYLTGQPERPKQISLKRLRFARVLKSGMYVTIEPGCYFIECLMDQALEEPKLSKFIVKDVFERFRKFGGVRIEDDVVIRKDKCENFAIVPRTIEEIEEWMAS